MKTRLRQRRGAITIMTALIFLSLVTCMAIAIDFSRLWTVRGELQTSADAGALAGAMQFINARDTMRIVDSATAYIKFNKTLGDTIKIDSLQKGYFDGTTRVFTPFPSGSNASNAVNVVVSYLPSKMWMRAFGSTVPRMKARAIAWAAAPVSDDPGCMKPWAMPYETLMYAINVYRGIANPGSNANLNRAFDQNLDMAALNQMTAAQRTFTLKQGSGIVAPVGGYNAANMPGNYQAVKLGKYWDYATQSIASPGPNNGGANAYRGHIDGTTCHGLAVGDSLITEPGNMVGPTMQGIEPAVCATVVQSGTNTGNCLDPAGNIGVTVKSAFFQCGTSCNGKSTVGVKLLGSFTITKAYPKNYNGHDKAEIEGVFQPTQSQGPAGGGSTTLTRLVLAK